MGIFRPQGRVFMSLYTSFLVLCHDRFIIDLPKPINDRECWFLAVAVSQISSATGNARAWKYGVGIFRPQGSFFDDA